MRLSDSTHPKWYDTDMNYLQVAKDEFVNEDSPHERIRHGYRA